MHKVFTTFVASAALLIGLMALPAVASAETCFNCSKESTDAIPLPKPLDAPVTIAVFCII